MEYKFLFFQPFKEFQNQKEKMLKWPFQVERVYKVLKSFSHSLQNKQQEQQKLPQNNLATIAMHIHKNISKNSPNFVCLKCSSSQVRLLMDSFCSCTQIWKDEN